MINFNSAYDNDLKNKIKANNNVISSRQEVSAPVSPNNLNTPRSFKVRQL